MEPLTFGQRLVELRESAGLSQKQLHERSGIHQAALNKIEKCRVEPGWRTVVKLARALNVSLDQFLPQNGAGDSQDRLTLVRFAKDLAKEAGLEVTVPKKRRRPAPGA